MNKAFCNTAIEFVSRESLLSLPKRFSGERILLLASESALRRFGLEAFFESLNASNDTLWYKECLPNPGFLEIADCIGFLGDFKPNRIVALGGGSVIDLAKGVCAFCYLIGGAAPGREAVKDAILSKKYLQHQAFPKIVAIPTTAGSGSELTSWATIWDKADSEKYSIDASFLSPELAVMCPELTYSMPKMLTLASGLDCVSHALESYWSKHTNPLVMELAKQSLTLSAKHLKNVLNCIFEPGESGVVGSTGCGSTGTGGKIAGGSTDGSTDSSIGRDGLMRASVLSALAFSQTRTTACHSISYPLTNLYGIEHGLAAALTLGEVYRLNRPALSNAGEIDDIFSDYGGVQRFLDSVCDGITTLRLSSFGVSIDDIPKIVSKAFTMGRIDNNPVDLSENDVFGILKNCM